MIYDSNNNITILTNITGFLKLSTNDVPTNPQKYTKDIFPMINPVKNFLKSILTRPAAMLTINAGVNGIAINKTNCVIVIFLNRCLYFFKVSLSSVNFSNLFPKPFLNIKYDIIQPKIVKIHDKRNPTNFPNTKKLIVIKATKGRIGKIDSIKIKKHPTNAPTVPLYSINDIIPSKICTI